MRTFILLASSLLAPSPDSQVLDRARELQLEYRQGNSAAAEPLVKMLEAAVAQSRDNAELWAALGHAYMSREGAISTSPPDIAKLIATAELAREAYAHSLALKPDNMLVLASHGMARLVAAQLQGDAAGVTAGVEEMNEAVRRAPKTITTRLTRAFTIIHFPPAVRDNDAVTEDLNFILDSSPGGRYDDVLHLLLGDVYAEVGNVAGARVEYQQIIGASAFAGDQVKSRLADLAKGAIDPAAVARVREGTGTQCAMCHAAGTDN